tara:strand:- start:69 stop:1391 length:1323 start_codon:yes stop_codon:yes gene_type:complete
MLIFLMFVPLAHAQSLDEALQECPGIILENDNNIQQIHLQMTDDPTEMSVIWATSSRETSAILEYRRGNTNGDSWVTSAESYCYGNHNMAFHMATMTDLPLQANGVDITTEIQYRLGDSNSQMTEWYTFNTIDPSSDHFEWISIADHGDSSEAMDVSEAIIADTSAQMVTISGDISYADGEQSAWDDWFNFQQDSMVNIPWITAVGNHENEPGYGFSPYEHRFDSDQQIESEIFWYSRDLPGVHMIFMSTEHDYSPGSTQYSWLEQDLNAVNREVTPFVIVYGHKPMYSSNSYHGSEFELREALEELYVAQGVDLVIAGHDHFYERTWPVSDEVIVDEGPIHLVIGIAGRSAYEELDEPQPAWSAYRENSTYGWTRLVYDGLDRELSLTHYRIDGSIGDQFVIQDKPLTAADSKGFLGVPGFGTMLPILAMLGAALQRSC